MFETFSQAILTSWNPHPAHSSDVLVDHEPQGIGNVAFEGFSWQVDPAYFFLFLKNVSQRSHNVGSRSMDLQVFSFVFFFFGDVAVDIDFVNGFKVEDSFIRDRISAQILFGSFRFFPLFE